MGRGECYERKPGYKIVWGVGNLAGFLRVIETGGQRGSRAAMNWILSALRSSPLVAGAGSASGKSRYLCQSGRSSASSLGRTTNGLYTFFPPLTVVVVSQVL